MNAIDLSEIHLTEQELIDYFQNKSLAADLPYLNAHLLKCSDCSERLLALIIFAIENKILNSKQSRIVDDYLESRDYDLFTKTFFRQVFTNFKNNGPT